MIRAKENLFTEKDGAVGWIRRVAMPFTPPTSTSVTRGPIVGVATKEIDQEGSARTTVGGGRVVEAAREIDGNKIPAGAEGARGKVADEEHTISAGNDGVV
jgi:hypothetical protein